MRLDVAPWRRLSVVVSPALDRGVGVCGNPVRTGCGRTCGCAVAKQEQDGTDPFFYEFADSHKSAPRLIDDDMAPEERSVPRALAHLYSKLYYGSL